MHRTTGRDGPPWPPYYDTITRGWYQPIPHLLRYLGDVLDKGANARRVLIDVHDGGELSPFAPLPKGNAEEILVL